MCILYEMSEHRDEIAQDSKAFDIDAEEQSLDLGKQWANKRVAKKRSMEG